MKIASMCIVLVAVTCAMAQEEPAGPTLNPGDDVSLEPVAAATWIQGQAPTEWETGKVYILECWATWCGPCIQAIPHVNELHKKYGDKGLVILGMNVWDKGEEKVAKFVKDKGDGMSYAVACVERGGAFEKQWLKPAGVRGIPNAFVVKNGKLLFRAHPLTINDEMVTALLEGGEAEAKVVQKIRDGQARQEKIGAVMRSFREATAAKDADAMAAAIADMEKIDAKASVLATMRLDHAMVTKDWPRATAMVTDLAEAPAGQRTLVMLGMNDKPSEEGEAYPAEFRKAIAGGLAKTMSKSDAARPTDCVVLASLYWNLDEKEAALAAARQAVAKPGNLPAEPFTEYLKSLEAGEPQTPQQVFTALSEAMRKQRAERAAAKQKQ